MDIQEFADRVFEDRKLAFAKRGFEHLDADSECATRVIPGQKYTKVDVGPASNWSGKFMVDADGNIYGIKAYGVINKRKHYGTLDTVTCYFWGEYHPIKLHN